jgi:hypothetical protein
MGVGSVIGKKVLLYPICEVFGLFIGHRAPSYAQKERRGKGKKYIYIRIEDTRNLEYSMGYFFKVFFI